MIEIEKKYKLSKNQFETIGKLLEFNLFDEYLEDNTLYNIAKPNVLRVRKISGPQGQNTSVTYKGEARVDADGIKSRKEVEFSTSSESEVIEFIEALNYRKTLVYEKNRTDYTFEDSEAKLSLDELPFGYYMEIEGTEKEIKALEEKFLKECDISFEVENYSYPDLTQIYGKSVNGIVEARFA